MPSSWAERSPGRLSGWLGAVAVEGLDGLVSGVGGSEVGAVPAEGLDPLGPGVLDVLGDQVGGVGVAAAAHRDVGGSGAGVLADHDVRSGDGVALRTVDRGGVGQLHEFGGVVGRNHLFASTPAQGEAPVVADGSHGPGLPVRDLQVGVVAAGRHPVPHTEPFPTPVVTAGSPSSVGWPCCWWWSRMAALRSAT